MADTLDTTAAPRRLLVDGRNPTADEAISSDDNGTLITIAEADADGNVLVSGVADAAGTVTIFVAPGAEDANRTTGTDVVEVTTPVAPTPLVVSLEP
jgi:hypothetical protein